ncbi:hypothetical protein HYS94_02010 [Candidatus Daviesbacteria bacterium]|nr:hypothetical protein [Candidatus Daviesbacteria bacterium]
MDNLEVLTSSAVCCSKEMDRLTDEVDIGVGIQTFTYGFECSECSRMLPACFHCGIPEDGRQHWTGCLSLKEIND